MKKKFLLLSAIGILLISCATQSLPTWGHATKTQQELVRDDFECRKELELEYRYGNAWSRVKNYKNCMKALGYYESK